MGKATPGLKAALKVVDRLGKQMYAESDADYSVALSASQAGTRALSKQTRALTRDLLLSSGQNRQAVQSLAQRARAGVKQVNADQARTVNQYGAAMGASAAQQYGVADATAQAGAKVVGGMAGATKAGQRAATTVAGIAQAGVKAGVAAAQYSMNQALQQRNIIDNQTLAGLSGQLYQTALQYNMQWEMWKKQQQYAEKQAERVGDPQLRADVSRLIGEGSNITVSAADAVRAYKNSDDYDPEQPIPVGEIVALWAEQAGYQPGTAEYTVGTSVIRNIVTQGMVAPDAYAQTIETLYSTAPGWEKWGQAALDAGMSAVQLDATRAYQASLTGEDAGPAEPSGMTGSETTGSLRGDYSRLRDSGTPDDAIQAALVARGYAPADVQRIMMGG